MTGMTRKHTAQSQDMDSHMYNTVVHSIYLRNFQAFSLYSSADKPIKSDLPTFCLHNGYNGSNWEEHV